MASSGANSGPGSQRNIPYTGDVTPQVSQGHQAAAANAAAVATLPGTAGKTTYLTGLIIVCGIAAAGAALAVTIAGVLGGTWTFDIESTTTSSAILSKDFGQPVPASAVNTSIVGTIPASGAAGPAIGITLVGYQL
jgi:hypothetical protein